jgi:hypothetical protein
LGFVLGGGRSPLMWAAFRGDTSIMKLLIDAGADVNGVGGLGTPLAQATWAGHTAAARLLLERGANVHITGPRDGYAPLHWAASSEEGNDALAKLLLAHGADPNQGGGEHIDAFMGTLQTPLMLARRRGDTPVLAALTAAGATNATADRVYDPALPAPQLPKQVTPATLADAMARAVAPLQVTSLKSKDSFVRHSSHQDCTSCHQQHLPMAATGLARKQNVPVDLAAEQKLVEIVKARRDQRHRDGFGKRSSIRMPSTPRATNSLLTPRQDLTFGQYSRPRGCIILQLFRVPTANGITTFRARRSRPTTSAQPPSRFMR